MASEMMNGEIRILMLEDDPADAKLVELALRRAEIMFAHQRVETQEDFVHSLDTFKPHVILADFKLPSFDGLSAVRIVRQKHPEVPVIMVTGMLGDEAAVELLHAGAKDYVLKDRLARLGPAIRRALAIEEGIRNRKLAEQKYRSLFTEARDGIALLDCAAGSVVECNPAFEQMSGRTLDDWKGRSILEEFMDAEQAERKEVVEAIQERLECMEELFLQRPNGGVVHAEVTPSVIRLQDVCYVQCIVHDVTERKRYEKALRENEARLKEMFENMSSGVVVYLASPDGRDFFITEFNRAAESIDKVRREEVIGKNVVDVFPGITEFGLLEVFRRVFKSGEAEHLPRTFYQDGRIAGWRDNYVYKLPHGEVVAIYDDVTEEKQAEERLHQLAHYDVLTGLPNRALFSDRVQQAIATAKRIGERLAVMYLDLDNFKPINDTLGHDVGDLLLREVAQRLMHCVRESDTVSRIGGDEFVLLLTTVASEEDAFQVAQKILHALDQPFEIAGRSLSISSSIGIALYPDHGSEEQLLIKNADTAMYHAKKNGRSSVRLYRPDMCEIDGSTALNVYLPPSGR